MYQTLINDIKGLQWSTFNPKSIIYISLCTAIEFAQSLRDALRVYASNHFLDLLARGELQTDNLSYEDYSRRGDHWEFLYHFCQKNHLGPIVEAHPLFYAKRDYFYKVRQLSFEQRAMTIFSREQELPDIFKVIAKAHDWDALGLGFFKHYLERHIELDSGEGGHQELTGSFPLDEQILFKFYSARLKLYHVLW